MAAYKYGRLPGLVPNSLKELGWYFAGTLPKAPAKVAVPAVPPDSDGTPWGVDGNDQYGDCGAAGLNHGFMAAASATGTIKKEQWPTDEDVVSYYLSYTGGKDTGVVLANYLAYVRVHQFYGHTLQAYAPVGVHDIPTLQFAINAYTFAYTGIVVTSAMESAYQNRQPWTLDDVSSPIAGGHCVPLVGYDSEYLYCVTWGTVQPIAYSAWHYISEEAWAVLPGEFITGDDRGINLSALKADLSKIGS